MNAVDNAFQQKTAVLVVGDQVVPAADGVNAVLWMNGRIHSVGRATDLQRNAPARCEQLHFPSAIITPGFIDSHTHFAQWALKRRQVDLTGAASRDEAVARVRAGVARDGWILGQGWDANLWSVAPDRAALDAVQPLPVFLDSLDVHAAWVNSAALRLAGIHPGTADPPGGRIVRDPAGEPTGVLLEHAVELVRRIVPAPPMERLRNVLLEGQEEAHRLGITGIHNVEDLRVLEAFRRLEREDLLRLRVLYHPPVAELDALARSGFRSGERSQWITSGGVKLFLDGSLGTRTAWMLAPYEGTTDRGMPLESGEDAAAAVRLAAGHGIASTVHAIGDAAVRRALEILEPLPRLAIPHRIEHFQCVDDADLDRAGTAGIVLSMQPAHLLVDIPLAERHWGRRGRGAYAFRTLTARGSRIAFGSDAPVAPLDPRPGVFAAMERTAVGRGGEASWYANERLPFVDVVRGYTETAAHAAGWLPEVGVLQPGAAADLVVWEADRDVCRGSGEAFLHAQVRLTVVGGEIVMRH